MNLIIAIIITDIQWLQSASKDQVIRDSILRDNIQNHIVIIIVMIQDWDCHDSHDPYCEHIIWQHDFSNLGIVLIWLSLFKMIIMAIFLLSRFSYTRRIMIMIIFSQVLLHQAHHAVTIHALITLFRWVFRRKVNCIQNHHSSDGFKCIKSYLRSSTKSSQPV